MANASPALARFRASYSAMLLAAEALRTELELAAGEPPAAPADVRALQVLVCHHYKIELAVLLSPARDNATCEPRHVAMALSRALTRHSVTVLGQAFRRTHDCVIHAARNVATRRTHDERFDRTYALLSEAARAVI